MNTILCITHRADFDGICSREIARKALGDTADYLGFDYGDELPQLTPYQTVYLIDISLPPGVMALHADKIILIDHHKSLIEMVASFKDRFKGYYCIDGVAACRLAWQWFHQSAAHAAKIGHWECVPEKDDYTSIPAKVSEPRAVELLGRFDIWDKRLPEVDLFQLGLQAEADPDWEGLLLPNDPDGTSNRNAAVRVNAAIDRGRAIHAHQTVMNAQMVIERGFDLVFEGLSFRVLNTRCNSMAFTAALKPHHDGCMAYYWNGSKWRFSLYGVPGKPNVDLSVIAVKHGGGGHKQACGFELSWLPRELGGSTEGVQVGNV